MVAFGVEYCVEVIPPQKQIENREENQKINGLTSTINNGIDIDLKKKKKLAIPTPISHSLFAAVRFWLHIPVDGWREESPFWNKRKSCVGRVETEATNLRPFHSDMVA